MSTKFPIDRVNNFSDAIFAIAITLLVLEIKVPTADEVHQLGVDGLLLKRLPNFIGYVVSFFVTALYWRNHLQLFQYVKSIDDRLFWLNLWLLFFVVIMPFSTALYSYFFGHDNAFIFYTLNLAAIGFMSYAMAVYVSRKEEISLQLGATQTRWMKNRVLIGPVIFLLSVPLVWLSPWVGRLAFFLIFIFQGVGERLMNKRIKRQEASQQPV